MYWRQADSEHDLCLWLSSLISLSLFALRNHSQFILVTTIFSARWLIRFDVSEREKKKFLDISIISFSFHLVSCVCTAHMCFSFSDTNFHSWRWCATWSNDQQIFTLSFPHTVRLFILVVYQFSNFQPSTQNFIMLTENFIFGVLSSDFIEAKMIYLKLETNLFFAFMFPLWAS